MLGGRDERLGAVRSEKGFELSGVSEGFDVAELADVVPDDGRGFGNEFEAIVLGRSVVEGYEEELAGHFEVTDKTAAALEAPNEEFGPAVNRFYRFADDAGDKKRTSRDFAASEIKVDGLDGLPLQSSV